MAQAEPMAMPTSTVLSAQGTSGKRSAQSSNPQCPQLRPCDCSRVPINIITSALRMLSGDSITAVIIGRECRAEIVTRGDPADCTAARAFFKLYDHLSAVVCL